MKRQILGVAVTVGIAAAAHGEEIKAVKKSGGQQVIDSLYGDVEGRIQTYQFVDGNGNTQGSRNLVLRPKLGTKMLNEKLDLNLTMPVTNNQMSSVTKQERPEAETTLSLYENSIMTVELYTFHYLQTKDQPYDGYVDLDVTLKKDFNELSIGKLETSVLIEPEANLTANSQPATITRTERIDGTALTEDERKNVGTSQQRETTKALNIYPKISLKPAGAPDLTLSFATIFNTTYTPEYVQKVGPDGETTLEKDGEGAFGYSISRLTQVRYTAKYQIKEGVFVYNQLRQNIDGFASAGLKSGTRLDNRTGIVMSLF